MKKTKINNNGFTLTFFSCLLIILITLTLFNLSFYFYSKPKVSYTPTNTTNQEISFWQSFLTSHPSYIEGWIALAKLDLRKGDKIGAEIAVQKAWKIDPNSVEILSLKNKIRD